MPVSLRASMCTAYQRLALANRCDEVTGGFASICRAPR